MQYAIGAYLDVSCSSAVTMAGSIDVDLIADVGSLELLISSRPIPRTEKPAYKRTMRSF